MTGLLIIVAATALIGLAIWWLDGRKHPPAEPEPEAERQPGTESAAAAKPPAGGGGGECCGLHIVCEKDSLSPVAGEIEYFDDEELDRFRGRSSDDYSDAEIEEFRDILLTMRPEEIAAWARSLQLRAIELPQTIREELLLIITEQRSKRAQG